MRKLGIIDVGSNSTRLILVDIYENGSFRIFNEIKESIRLISDMGDDGIIKPKRIIQLVKTLQMFKRLCEANEIEEIFPYVTAAVRKVANQRSFLDEIYATTDISLKVMTEEQETTFVYQGVVNSIDIDHCVIVDLGGSTIELIQVERRAKKNHYVIPFGAVTLTEIFSLNDRVSEEQLANIHDFMISELEKVPWLKNMTGTTMVGVGGSFRNVGKIVRKKNRYSLEQMAHNYHMTIDDIQAVYDAVRKLDLSNKLKIKGLSNDRADIFMGALAAIKAMTEYTESSEVVVSCAGLREGIVFEQVNPVITSKPISDVLDFSIRNLCNIWSDNIYHSQNVYALALSMFDQLRQLHKLPNSYIKILKVAALMHDAGSKIRYYDHHRHSFHIIMNSNLYGLGHRELLMAAFIAGGHRKDEMKHDFIKHMDILREEDLDIIKKISVLVRIAESFDRCMSGVIQSVACDILGDSVIMKTSSNVDASLEIKDALTSGNLFKQAYGKNLVII